MRAWSCSSIPARSPSATPASSPVDPLGFVDQKPYPDRLAAAQVATGLRDAAVWGVGPSRAMPVAIAVMDFGFMGGSMGAVVGEKIARAAEDARLNRIPLIIVSASGGARMQEGTLALMQLAKTVAALERLRPSGVPFICVLTDPTTGGVFASYAALGDINLAEPNALIGFAGARVAAGTIAQELPPGFQRSEFLFEHGFIDRVVHRRALKAEIAGLLRFMRPPELAVDALAGRDQPARVPDLCRRDRGRRGGGSRGRRGRRCRGRGGGRRRGDGQRRHGRRRRRDSSPSCGAACRCGAILDRHRGADERDRRDRRGADPGQPRPSAEPATSEAGSRTDG